jgi:hypothetical protein
LSAEGSDEGEMKNIPPMLEALCIKGVPAMKGEMGGI